VKCIVSITQPAAPRRVRVGASILLRSIPGNGDMSDMVPEKYRFGFLSDDKFMLMTSQTQPFLTEETRTLIQHNTAQIFD
jgi:hypothetical protein